MRNPLTAHHVRLAVMILAATVLSACITPYVDTTIHDLADNEKVKVVSPQPVQVLFEFQTKGVHNGQGTDLAKKQVLAAIQDTGLFSQVSSNPVPGGALLNVVINNVPTNDDAFVKGFVTGATFYIVGSTVGDGYICTVDYLPGANATKITKSMKDVIYSSLGATAPTPQHARKMPSLKEAFGFMIHKLVGNTVNEVAKDQAFAAIARVAS